MIEVENHEYTREREQEIGHNSIAFFVFSSFRDPHKIIEAENHENTKERKHEIGQNSHVFFVLASFRD